MSVAGCESPSPLAVLSLVAWAYAAHGPLDLSRHTFLNIFNSSSSTDVEAEPPESQSITPSESAESNVSSSAGQADKKSGIERDVNSTNSPDFSGGRTPVALTVSKTPNSDQAHQVGAESGSTPLDGHPMPQATESQPNSNSVPKSEINEPEFHLVDSVALHVFTRESNEEVPENLLLDPYAILSLWPQFQITHFSVVQTARIAAIEESSLGAVALTVHNTYPHPFLYLGGYFAAGFYRTDRSKSPCVDLGELLWKNRPSKMPEQESIERELGDQIFVVVERCKRNLKEKSKIPSSAQSSH